MVEPKVMYVDHDGQLWSRPYEQPAGRQHDEPYEQVRIVPEALWLVMKELCESANLKEICDTNSVMSGQRDDQDEADADRANIDYKAALQNFRTYTVKGASDGRYVSCERCGAKNTLMTQELFAIKMTRRG